MLRKYSFQVKNNWCLLFNFSKIDVKFTPIRFVANVVVVRVLGLPGKPSRGDVQHVLPDTPAGSWSADEGVAT